MDFSRSRGYPGNGSPQERSRDLQVSYFPKFLGPEDKTLDLEEFIQSRYWHKIEFSDISAGDRILIVRVANGTRMVVESVVSEHDYGKGAWLNSLGTPVVSIFDHHVFRSGEAPDDQSKESDDSVLGD